MCIVTAAQRAGEHLQDPPNEQTLLLTSVPESLEYFFEHPTRRLTDLVRDHQDRLERPLNELQRQKEQRYTLQISRVLASYQKLWLFERFLWSSALCEYLAATVGPVLDLTTAAKHAAVLHLRLFRRQAHIRGDSAGAAAIQIMQFWTRPDRGLLASSLSRWMALLQRKRAKRRLEKLAEEHSRGALIFRGFIAWRPFDSKEASCDGKTPCGSPTEKRKLTVNVSSCEGAAEVALHQHRGVLVASARMRRQADGCRSPDGRLPGHPLSSPSLTQPPWSPSGPSKSPAAPEKRMPNLELLRKQVARRQKSSVVQRDTTPKESTPQAHQSWISASSSFRDSKQLSPMSSFRASQSVQG